MERDVESKSEYRGEALKLLPYPILAPHLVPTHPSDPLSFNEGRAKGVISEALLSHTLSATPSFL